MFRQRVYVIVFFMGLLFLGILGRLYYVQVVQYSRFVNLKEKQYIQTVEIKPRRGTIYDCQGRELAMTIDVDSVCAFPRLIKNKTAVAEKIASVLDKSVPLILEKLNTQKYFVWIERKITEEQSKRLKEMRLPGIDLLKEGKRFYPEGILANQLIGFVGIDNVGLTGIEKCYDEYIKGESSYILRGKDAKGRGILNDFQMCYASSGSQDIVLTIDKTIQYIAEREIDEIWRRNKAKTGLIIVQKTKTGEILALAGRPTFSGEKLNENNMGEMRIKAISDFYEPGSTFKIITASAALEEKVVTVADRYFCENGKYKVGSTYIRDHEKEGWLTFAQVIERSSNIGCAKVADKLGKEKMYYYARLFGFGAPTGIGLSGEAEGLLRQTRDWSGISLGRISFGQEIGVTPLQLINAVSAVANGGVLMQPFIVKSMRSKDGSVAKEYRSQQIRQVISPDTAHLMKDILKGVVERGTGVMAQVKGYKVAGKTGTAQKIDPLTKKYSSSHYVASFVGYIPADDPEITILVIVDEPKGVYWGGSICAPVFSRVAGEVMRYLNIPAEEPLLAKAW